MAVMAVKKFSMRRLVAVALLATMFTATLPALDAEAATFVEIRKQLQGKINNARQARGLRPLKVSELMTTFARGHAINMGNRGEIFHDSSAELWLEVPDGAWWRAENVGYVTDGAGVAKRMHRAFMNSSGHKANILKRRATHMGIGVVKMNGKVWVVERFADMKP